MSFVAAASIGTLVLALVAASGDAGTVGPTFIASIATLVIAVAGLVRAVAYFRAVSAKVDAAREAAERAATKATEAAEQVNGKMSEKDAEIRRLRSELDTAHTQISHQRRTIETLVGKGEAPT